MNADERRRHPRYVTKVETTIHADGLKVSAIMTDIGVSGFGIISEKAIQPGTEVYLSLKLKGKYSIQGSVIWSSQIYKEGKIYYYMGIEADMIIVPDIKAIGFLKRSELVEELLFQINEEGGKSIETA